MIQRITKVEIIKFTDNGQRKAYVYWVDHKGKSGRTEGKPRGLHMQALIQRARKEKVRIERKTW